ncbi:hypothetical protein KC887_01100 [Candidatus Kaiserbacteria bacterium]|nr:hypothetical protein [Candidatus Kaiserbacteria bacterium]
MPIVGLTTNGAAFPRIGELRKGAEKPATGNRPGADLDHFRFTSTNHAVSQKFYAVYDKEPQAINIFLPYATTDENFEAWQEEWGAGSLKHRCDGEHVVMIQRNGQYVQPAPGAVKCPGNCKQVGRLKVIIPELGRLAYVVALTTSIWDITEVHSNLAAYEALRGDLRGIPFILSRVPRMISTPGKDGRVRREKWLWHIEPSHEWVNALFPVMQRQALPGAAPLSISSGIDSETGEILEPENEPAEDGDYEEAAVPADWSMEFLNYCASGINRYAGNPFKAKTALQKQFDAPPVDKAAAKRQFEWLKEHAAERDREEIEAAQEPLFAEMAVADGAYSEA